MGQQRNQNFFCLSVGAANVVVVIAGFSGNGFAKYVYCFAALLKKTFSYTLESRFSCFVTMTRTMIRYSMTAIVGSIVNT